MTTKKALTPEQWNAHFTFPEGGFYSDQLARLGKPEDAVGTPLLLGERLAVTNDIGVFSGVVDIPQTERHSLAALALHWQPFGFTYQDVRWLRSFLDQEGTPGTFMGIEMQERLYDLANRIESLLPPKP